MSNNEYYHIFERAQRLERAGNDDKALELYLEIHENYQPNLSQAYERPAIILEKKRRYDEAIDMCEKAISMIEKDIVAGSTEKFHSRIEKIKLKQNKSTPIKEKERIKFRISLYQILSAVILIASYIISRMTNWVVFPIVFLLWFYYKPLIALMKDRSLRNILKSGGMFLIGFVVFMGMIMFLPRNTHFDDIYIDFSTMYSDQEKVDRVYQEEEFQDLPKIKEDYIVASTREIILEEVVEDAYISVYNDTVVFAIKTLPDTSVKASKELALDYIKSLAKMMRNEGLSGPFEGYLGELYDYYNIIVAVGYDKDNIYAQGKKEKKTNRITWE
jgi:tetratricopeptide (TPR) repeat protein